MIFGDSDLMDSPGNGGPAMEAHDGGGASGGSSEVGASTSIPCGGLEEIHRGSSRWPKQETLALIKIRSDMDTVFREASIKAPLWEDVSRKMAELGFQRSAKKCREKFENVYKYHKRTKDGRASKYEGKSYRFFDQLEALENNSFSYNNQSRHHRPAAAAPVKLQMQSHVSASAILPTSPTPVSVLPPHIAAPRMSSNPMNSSSPSQPTPVSYSFQPSNLHISSSLLSDSMSSSSASSDEDMQRGRGRKRKWKDYLQILMREVIQKQEERQKRLLETVEQREMDRIAKEEAWRVQEMARINSEHDLLVRERSMAAAKDAAMIAFLQKITDQHNLQIPAQLQQSQPSLSPVRQQLSTLLQLAEPPTASLAEPSALWTGKKDNGGDRSSSRWPKAEVQALIKLRTSLDLKYQEGSPKGPLWEEISTAMSKIGYNRSSKRCKEKWENINKYYKKVKETNKKRAEDSKTCPYFHQLEAIHEERAKNKIPSLNPSFSINPNSTVSPVMAQPEQQWPLPVGLNNELEDEEDNEDDEVYEMITNQHSSTATNTGE